MIDNIIPVLSDTEWCAELPNASQNAGVFVSSDYEAFIDSKKLTAVPTGKIVDPDKLHPQMKDHQRVLTHWSLRKGRAALFADTGLGKTLMELVWAQHAGNRCLILAPLAVAMQTVEEGKRWGIPVKYCKDQSEIDGQITITNYERLDHFNPDFFDAVVLDESSILKSFEGKTRTRLIEAFADTPMRLCGTATPAPNDIAEIANHAEFLGIMSRTEMLSTFFVHDDAGWRLKGHAVKPFYKWLASWSMAIRKPSDLGFSDEGYDLPALVIHPVIVSTQWKPEGQLFATDLKGITQRSEVRKATLPDRVKAATDIIGKDADTWLIWTGLNDEADAIEKAVTNAIQVKGADSPELKAENLLKFAKGELPIMVTKPSIAAYGMNFQHYCHNMLFVGLGDSYEDYYQAIRRVYRFGQTQPVNVYIVLSEPEQVIYQNVLRKQEEARKMVDELINQVAEFEKAEIAATVREKDEYSEAEASGKEWRLLMGDSAKRMKEIPTDSIALSVSSIPFATLFTYSNSDHDLGNSKDYQTFFEHMGYITREWLRITMPGRNVAVHVQQLPMTKATDGVIGIRDFRGDTIRHFTEQGFIYHGEVCIDKDPQAQAIRTHSKGLMFVQLHKDSAWSRPAFADYILIFRKPGDNPTPVIPDISNDEWIEWARPIWYGIRESDTLNVVEARTEEDERHICPLQLGTIERCVRLWSNPGETVFDPFNGIGSTPYTAVKFNRKGLGIELKPEYFKVACKNLTDAEAKANRVSLFDYAGIEV